MPDLHLANHRRAAEERFDEAEAALLAALPPGDHSRRLVMAYADAAQATTHLCYDRIQHEVERRLGCLGPVLHVLYMDVLERS